MEIDYFLGLPVWDGRDIRVALASIVVKLSSHRVDILPAEMVESFKLVQQDFNPLSSTLQVAFNVGPTSTCLKARIYFSK